jgi:glucokinase
MSAPPLLVAVDFSADTLRLLLADADGAPVLRERWDLPELADEDAWSWEVGGRIATLFAHEGGGRSALAIAVAAPGAVDPLTGRLLSCSERPEWDALAVVDALRRHIDAPIAAESRTLAALLGEGWQGAAVGVDHALYVSLRGVPSAALLMDGRPARGASHRAGTLTAVPELDPTAAPREGELAEVAAAVADAVAVVDPELVVLDAAPEHLERLTPLLQRAVDEGEPGPEVTPAALGDEAALLGALRIARGVAHESGPRR